MGFETVLDKNLFKRYGHVLLLFIHFVLHSQVSNSDQRLLLSVGLRGSEQRQLYAGSSKWVTNYHNIPSPRLIIHQRWYTEIRDYRFKFANFACLIINLKLCLVISKMLRSLINPEFLASLDLAMIFLSFMNYTLDRLGVKNLENKNQDCYSCFG